MLSESGVSASSSYFGVLKSSFVRIRDVLAVRAVEVSLSVNVFGVNRIVAECG